MSYQLASAKVWDGTQWVAAAGGGGGPTDWSAYTTEASWKSEGGRVSTAAESWHTAINVSGYAGWLTFARASAGHTTASNPDVRITVDGGSPVLFEGAVATAGQGNVIPVPIPFTSSLKVEVFNRDTSARPLGLDYTVLRQTGSPTGESTVLTAGSRKMAYHTTTSTSLVDVVNVSGSGWLVAAQLECFYGSTNAISYGEIAVDANEIMPETAHHGSTNAGAKPSIMVGPVRFEGSLVVRHRVFNSTAVGRVWYVLD